MSAACDPPPAAPRRPSPRARAGTSCLRGRAWTPRSPFSSLTRVRMPAALLPLSAAALLMPRAVAAGTAAALGSGPQPALPLPKPLSLRPFHGLRLVLVGAPDAVLQWSLVIKAAGGELLPVRTACAAAAGCHRCR